jgi:phage FluMu gp28-like protein
MIEIPRDAEILSDHRGLVIDKGVVRPAERRTRDEAGHQRHSDSAIAGALAYHASLLTAPAPFAYTPATRQQSGEQAAAVDDDVKAARRGPFAQAGAW